MSTPHVAETSEWRANIPQSYRSAEVNTIADVLARLEPGATSASKLMLASQFENMMFSAASDLADYRKKIQKRLKKMQKNYHPPAAMNGEALLEQKKEEVVQLQRKLKSLYGEKLELIVKYGRHTVNEFREKCGDQKSKNLMDHVDQAITWAAEIGAVPVDKSVLVATGKTVRIPRRSPEETLAYLNKISADLEKRVDNIRGYCVKLTRPDLFFAERLDEMETNVLLKVDSPVFTTFVDSLKEALQSAGVDISAPAMVPTSGIDKDAGVEALKDILEKLKTIIPIPRSKEEEKEAMLGHLNRIRAACQFFISYSALSPDQPNTKLQLAGSIRKVYEGVHESLTVLRQAYKEDRSREGITTVLLEDVWTKLLDYDREMNEASTTNTSTLENNSIISEDTSSSEQAIVQSSARKSKPVVIRSKVLFSKRVPPKNLLDAIKKKYDVKVCGVGKSTYLKVAFGEAFEMSLYFCPLLVKIRALPDKEDKAKFAQSAFRKEVVDCKVDAWNSATYALKTTPLPVQVVQQSGGKKRNASGKIKTKQTVSIMGVSADIALLVPVVAKKIEFASAQATLCLRRFFAEGTKTCKSDFEIEISEGNAVLKFLQLARKTYEPELDDNKMQ